MTSSEVIINLRTKLKLTQQELANRLNLSKTAIFNYERGERKPKLSIIKQIKKIADENGIKIKLDDFLN